MGRNYRRLEYPRPGQIGLIVVVGWLDTPTILKARTDGEDAIAVLVPQAEGIEWNIQSANGSLTVGSDKELSDTYAATLYDITILVPRVLMSGRRHARLERREL